MARSLRLGVLALLLAGCAGPPAPPPAAPPPAPTSPAPPPAMPLPPTPTAGARLADVSARYLAEYLRRSPVAATAAGSHEHDGAWPAMRKAADQEELAFVERTLAELDAIPAAELDAEGRVDRETLANQLRYERFWIVDLRPSDNDPVSYTRLIGDGLDPLLTRDFAPPADRVKSLTARLDGIAEVVAAAKERLQRPPRVFTETAITQNKGLVELCEKGLNELLTRAPAEKEAAAAAAKRAAAALRDFGAFLEKELLPRSDADFRLGRPRFEKKLRFELDDQVDIDALATSARESLRRTQEEMAVTALSLAKELFPRERAPAASTPAERKTLVKRVLAKLAEERSTNDTIVKDAAKTLDEATAFVRAKDLVEVPTEPCKVIEMPEYRRGVAIAYCDSSGPLEAKQETFYAISPTPADWSKERALSFYREYNHSMLEDLTVHEAMPGHFLQLMHNNRFPSKVRALFSSGAFVEGWAVYAEWLMADNGYGGARVALQRQKMMLRVAANAVLDHDIHAGQMTEAEALALMKDEAFQEDGEAVGKWKRARLSSAQLTTYFYGVSRMMELRASSRAKAGAAFRERAFHDALLSHGSPALRYMPALLGLSG